MLETAPSLIPLMSNALEKTFSLPKSMGYGVYGVFSCPEVRMKSRKGGLNHGMNFFFQQDSVPRKM